jgi:hypothetical protein
MPDKNQKRKYRLKGRYTPQVKLKEELKKVNWKLMLQLLISCAVVIAVYQTALYFNFAPIMWIYYGLLILSAFAFLYFNKGISKNVVTRDELPEEWSESEKDNVLEKRAKHKNIAKKLLLLIIPLLLTFAFDVIYLFYLDNFI